MLAAYYRLVAVTLVLAEVHGHATNKLSKTEIKSNLLKTQWTSPCPNLFEYESLNPDEPDRWYGTLTILSDVELNGVWLRLIFDKPSLEVVLAGNWSGDVVSKDNKDYLVKNPKQTVAPNTPYKVRFYVKYNSEEEPPKLHSFRLNAQTVCSRDGTTSPTLVSVEGSNQEVACGTVVTPPRPGQETHEAEFPWHAALYQSRGNDLRYMCGASLIGRNHLVTAAHCVTQNGSPEPLSADSLVIYFGKSYRKKWASPEIQARQVDQIILHPEYATTILKNDIAIIKLASPVQITEYVRPVCLWVSDQQLQDAFSASGTVVGWALDKTGKVTEQLTKTDMSIVSRETCISSDSDFYSKLTSDKTLCAGFNKDTSLCNGDAGSGLVFPKSAPEGGTVWELRGLVSVSVAQQKPLQCDASRFGVFTDVAKYTDWIKATLN